MCIRDKLGTIPRGGEMTLVAFDGAFALVDYAGQRGYVLSTYIVPKLDSASPGGGFGYADLQEGLERLAAEHPEELELSSIGQSAEGDVYKRQSPKAQRGLCPRPRQKRCREQKPLSPASRPRPACC